MLQHYVYLFLYGVCLELKQWGLPFVLGVISAMDGERDPRNLMFLFDWLPEFFKTIDLVHLTEDMFEVIACYFPIDFRAPPTDPDVRMIVRTG